MLGAGTLKATLEDCLLEMKVFQTITHKTNLRNAKRCSLKKKKKDVISERRAITLLPIRYSVLSCWL